MPLYHQWYIYHTLRTNRLDVIFNETKTFSPFSLISCLNTEQINHFLIIQVPKETQGPGSYHQCYGQTGPTNI